MNSERDLNDKEKSNIMNSYTDSEKLNMLSHEIHRLGENLDAFGNAINILHRQLVEVTGMLTKQADLINILSKFILDKEGKKDV